jgi:NADP-dependent 3-hydroxy acid dehydrogenase YdfG
MKDLHGKVAAITGAGSGIGRALALELTGRGTKVALADIDTPAVEETARRCRQRGGEAVSYGLDVRDRSAVYAFADAVVAEYGKVNVVINNAGVALVATIADTGWDDMHWVMDVDFWGIAHGTKAFLPHLVESGDGHVVNMSSLFGIVGCPDQGAYCAAKFAVRGFTETLRQELRIDRLPVGVTSVHPGGIRTSLFSNSRGIAGVGNQQKLDETFRATIARTSPERAAKVIVTKAVQQGKPRVLIGPDAHTVNLVQRVLGTRYEGLMVPLARRGKAKALKAGVRL